MDVFKQLDPIGTLLFVPAIICLLLALVSLASTIALLRCGKLITHSISNGPGLPMPGAAGVLYSSSSCSAFFSLYLLQCRYAKEKQQRVWISQNGMTA
jgi:hypothetical protein